MTCPREAAAWLEAGLSLSALPFLGVTGWGQLVSKWHLPAYSLVIKPTPDIQRPTEDGDKHPRSRGPCEDSCFQTPVSNPLSETCLPVSWGAGKPLAPPLLMPPTARAARYLLCRGLLSVGIIVGEGPVEGGDVQAAVGPGEQAQPSLAGGGVASGSLREVQALGDTLHQHCSAGRGRGGWYQA